ncbi:class I SAM-dependent methyltransferase [Candidatus Methylocalor cossyra]|uniref:class I SAM-dependent methyltransferase n=1 Tax=Candidatus Methylocalor cossyra TaxID=3108543 RepID=UPI0032B205E3
MGVVLEFEVVVSLQCCSNRKLGRCNMFYIEFLEEVHKRLAPELYVEIGVRNGKSMGRSRCLSYGIDPDYEITYEMSPHVQLFKCTSDMFFDRENLTELFCKRIDLAFIDGMHLFEYVVRDFINIEKWSSHGSVVIVDDVYPRNDAEASRSVNPISWTGDVWKIIPCLKEYRPDLTLLNVDIEPTGLLVVLGLDADNRILAQEYELIVERYVGEGKDRVPVEIVNRVGAYKAEDILESGIFEAVAAMRVAKRRLETGLASLKTT